MTFKPFTGTVAEYSHALGEHNLACEICAPDGLPNTNDVPLCVKGRQIRWGLEAARQRERP